MIVDVGDPNCEHVWEEVDDPDAYNDGFNCPVAEICTKCYARRPIDYDNKNSKNLKWFEYLLLIPFCFIVILYLTIAPILILIGAIIDESSKKDFV
jgi:hypothetical protein